MGDNAQVEELFSFITSPSTPESIRNSAAHFVLGLTGDIKGVEHLLTFKNCLPSLCSIGNEENSIGKIACKCLINISSYEAGACALSDIDEISFLQWLVDGLDCHAPFVDLKCHIISNISGYVSPCEKVATWFHSSLQHFKKLIDCFCSQDSSMVANYTHLASLFGNLTQTSSGRRLFLNKDTPFIKNLLPYTTFMDSEVRRIGVARALRNCCFSIDDHSWLLEEIEILPVLLLPLAGPEEFDDDENEKLPIDLQYLGEDKQREPNPIIRKLLMEAITKLCATKHCRMFVKDSGAYYILRELHKWETDESSFEACENLVDILIGDEPEPGMENLMDVKIPKDIEERFMEQDKNYIEADAEKIFIS